MSTGQHTAGQQCEVCEGCCLRATEVMSTAPALSKRWKHDGRRTIFTDDAGHLLICEVFSGGIGNAEADKVQRAIAALPDLLEQLQHAARFFDQLTAADAARYSAAIAKATGSQS